LEEIAMKWIVLSFKAIGLLLLVAACGLWLAGRRAGAGHLHSEIEVNRPVAEVWDWVSEPEKLKQWISWLVEVRTDDMGHGGVGVKRVLVMRDENNGGELVNIESTCTEYAPPKLLRTNLVVPRMFDGTQSYRVTDLGNGSSRLEIDSQFHFGNPFAKLMEPLITSSAQKKMRRDIARLKQLAEGSR
jgi:carbon monoxide dehydrogenase subunit G